MAKQDRLKWFGHPVWGFLAAIATLIGIPLAVIALYFGWPGRTDKGVKWGVVSQGPLVSVRDDAKGRLTVLFDGKPRKDLNLALLRLDNSGYVPIAMGDFQRAVSFDLGARVLRAEIASSSPTGIGAVVSSTGRHVTLKPLLLNGGDSVVLKVIVAGPVGKVTAAGRIQGVSRLIQTDFAAHPSALRTALLSTLPQMLWSWFAVWIMWYLYRRSDKAWRASDKEWRELVLQMSAALDPMNAAMDLMLKEWRESHKEWRELVLEMRAGEELIIEGYERLREQHKELLEERDEVGQLLALNVEWRRLGKNTPLMDIEERYLALQAFEKRMKPLEQKMRRRLKKSKQPPAPQP